MGRVIEQQVQRLGEPRRRLKRLEAEEQQLASAVREILGDREPRKTSSVSENVQLRVAAWACRPAATRGNAASRQAAA